MKKNICRFVSVTTFYMKRKKYLPLTLVSALIIFPLSVLLFSCGQSGHKPPADEETKSKVDSFSKDEAPSEPVPEMEVTEEQKSQENQKSQ
jgi:hypothetical protein